MKNLVLSSIIALCCISCNAQDNSESEMNKVSKNDLQTQPKGNWKVDKSFDEEGNLIRYDSIYSWSSNKDLKMMSDTEKDSLLKSIKSKFFNNFSQFETQNFEDIFASDSILNKHFFESDFGNDFMDIDNLREHFLEKQKAFLEKYQPDLIKPEDNN
ncbi:hypothetical protein [Winogradskyella undariae]|uniref:hypothetical protein n=1 Tax=Winogradskyella undariae TaxID=1285465 RepID=UPI0015CBA737|nr:hypothetical protein [Winogradskyella undariae]